MSNYYWNGCARKKMEKKVAQYENFLEFIRELKLGDKTLSQSEFEQGMNQSGEF